MKVVVQKCKRSSVTVDGKLVNEIGQGLCILVGFTQSDTVKEIDYIVNKVTKLRIFEDENMVMNKSVIDVGGEILSISQFTLYANPYDGNRPSYINALNGPESSILYDTFNEKLNQIVPTKTGIFGAYMDIELINDGPTTIILDSNKTL